MADSLMYKKQKKACVGGWTQLEGRVNGFEVRVFWFTLGLQDKTKWGWRVYTAKTINVLVRINCKTIFSRIFSRKQNKMQQLSAQHRRPYTLQCRHLNLLIYRILHNLPGDSVPPVKRLYYCIWLYITTNYISEGPTALFGNVVESEMLYK